MFIFLNEEQECFGEQKVVDESVPCEWIIDDLLKRCFRKYFSEMRGNDSLPLYTIARKLFR